ncbi:MAG TPA: hypothetical protein PKV58_07090 [Kaistella sp.]|nr:hypothetical protein [Kaistella sp.]
MKNLFFISIIAFSMIACKKNSEQLSEKKSTADAQQLENSKTCYRSVIGQDTVKLAITIAEGNISHNDIYLLQKNGKLYEGVGEILKINDSTAIFANPSKIDYTKSFIFSKVICK